MIQEFLGECRRYRAVAEKAMSQVSDEDLNRIASPDGNSIAMIVRHLSGNMTSRFTDFLTTDGDKPWRHRDAEFETRQYTRQELQEFWEKGWVVLEATAASLRPEDMEKTVNIRGEPLTARHALVRSAAHLGYHAGQIVMLARMFAKSDWKWISIPKKMPSHRT